MSRSKSRNLKGPIRPGEWCQWHDLAGRPVGKAHRPYYDHGGGAKYSGRRLVAMCCGLLFTVEDADRSTRPPRNARCRRCLISKRTPLLSKLRSWKGKGGSL